MVFQTKECYKKDEVESTFLNLFFIFLITLMVVVPVTGSSTTCYGVECIDRPEPKPERNDWGWESDYCTGFIEVHQFNETHTYLTWKPYCYI